MPLTRRSFLKVGGSASAAVLLDGHLLLAELAREPLIQRAIPRTGEMLPVIGLGSVSFLNIVPDHPDFGTAQDVMKRFLDLGGTVIDTAPGYRNAESFIGETLRELGAQDQIFIATKFNAFQGQGGGGCVRAAVRPRTKPAWRNRSTNPCDASAGVSSTCSRPGIWAIRRRTPSDRASRPGT